LLFRPEKGEVMETLKKELEEIFRYILKFARNPLKHLKTFDNKSPLFLCSCVFIVNVLVVLLSHILNGFSFFIIKIELKHCLVFSVITFGFAYLLKYALKMEIFSVLTDNLKSFITELFIKTQIVTVVLSALIIQLFGYQFTIFNFSVLVFLITFGTFLTVFKLNSQLNHKNSQLKYSFLVALAFQVALYLFSPQYNYLWLPLPDDATIIENADFSDLTNRGNRLVQMEALAEGDNDLFGWFAELSDQTDIALDNPEPFGESVESDPYHPYSVSIQCIRFIAKERTPAITEKIKKIMLYSEERIDKYINLQRALSGRQYTVLSAKDLVQRCRI
jgi:hypothetical protein